MPFGIHARLTALFETLEYLEPHLAEHTYLVGKRITEADWRLFTTLIRFDPVYVTHFKCNFKRIRDCPNLHAYLKCLYAEPGIAQTVNMAHTKMHCFGSHRSINPTGVVPKGPADVL